MMRQVAIVVPVGATQETAVQDCLESVSQQTLRDTDFEVIVVTDGSTSEATLRVCERAESTYAHIRLLRLPEHHDLASSRAAGVTAATAAYVMFVDGTDMLARDSAESLSLHATVHGADVVTAPMYRWFPGDSTYAEIVSTIEPFANERALLAQQIFTGTRFSTLSGRLFKRDLLTDECFNTGLHGPVQDWVVLPRLLCAATKISHLPRAGYYRNDSRPRWDHPDGSDGVVGEIESIVDDWSELADDLGISTSEYDTWIRTGRHLVGRQLASADSAATDEAAEIAPPRRGLGPSELAVRLTGRIVFVCQVDYQIRNALKFASRLVRDGQPCAILDNSKFAAHGKRQPSPEDVRDLHGVDYFRIESPPYQVDWLATARFVAVFNDFNDDFREALEYRHRLRLPTACVIEGINDFRRVDFDTAQHLPYRRCPFVFLAGPHDAQYFEDRISSVIGLPGIEELAAATPRFPIDPLIAVNLNFTYGSLEDRRELFLSEARSGIEATGYRWLVTKHPMDRRTDHGIDVTSLTQYELIDRCSVFVSRFATGILEALASGKPVVYFNPHGERVEKFLEPRGAYDIAMTGPELTAAIERAISDTANGIDFRLRASEFLREHTALDLDDGSNAVARFADATYDALDRCDDAIRVATARCLRSQLDPAGVYFDDDSLLQFPQRASATFDAEGFVTELCASEMGAAIPIVEHYQVEHDVREPAESGQPSEDPVPTAAGDETTAQPTARWTVRSLRSEREESSDVDRRALAKISVISASAEEPATSREDPVVFTGSPHGIVTRWLNTLPRRPSAIIVDAQPAGIRADAGWTSIAQALADAMFSVFVSEWHPLDGDDKRAWRGLYRYSPAEVSSTVSSTSMSSASVSNLVCFAFDPDRDVVVDAALNATLLNRPLTAGALGSSGAKRTKRPGYSHAADRLREIWPAGYHLMRRLRRGLARTARPGRRIFSGR